MSDVLDTRVTGADPNAWGEYRTRIKASSSWLLSDGTDTTPTTDVSTDDGMLIYPMHHSSAGTSGEPNFWEMYVGSTFIVSIETYIGTGRNKYNLWQHHVLGSSATHIIGFKYGYDPDSGLVYVVAGNNYPSGTLAEGGWPHDGATSTTDLPDEVYFDVIAMDYS